MGSRVGVLGVNGAGKSTLIKLILGELKPTKGFCRFNPHARAALFTQHHMDQLDLTVSAMAYFQHNYPEAKEDKIRGVLGRFGFDERLANQKMQTLSGGQRSRVAFAVLTWKEPHLIMMDEPTNHLDLETIESLIEAIQNFEGAVLLVSHDQYFLNKVATSYWALNEEGEVGLLYDLEEAKEFSYNIVDPTLTKRADLIKAEKEALIAEKAKNKMASSTTGDAETSNAGRVGKKKRRTKKGGGGIQMAELDELVEEMQAQQDRAEQKIVDVVIDSPPHSDDDENEEDEDDAMDEEVEVEDEEQEDTQPSEHINQQKPQKKKKEKKEKGAIAAPKYMPVNAFSLLDMVEDNQPSDDDDSIKKKKKKKKQADESDAEDASDKKKKKKKKQLSDDEDADVDGDKKKKKKKQQVDEEVEEEVVEKKKQNKNHD
jgi:ABC-type Mn2+/Zn2+ transport system ATPase subunit